MEEKTKRHHDREWREERTSYTQMVIMEEGNRKEQETGAQDQADQQVELKTR